MCTVTFRMCFILQEGKKLDSAMPRPCVLVPILLEGYKAATVSLLLLTLSFSRLSTHYHSLTPSHSFISSSLFIYMVKTRPQNRNMHPAAPVMSKAAKVKAGIKPAKHHTKKATKDEQIHQLQAELAALKNPDQIAPVSKEPLVNFPSLSCTQQKILLLLSSLKAVAPCLTTATYFLLNWRLQLKLVLTTL